MKRSNILSTVAFLALMVPAAAHADGSSPRDAWYVGAGGVGSFASDADSKSAGVTDSIKYDTGWGLSSSGGYSWSNGMRAEGEFTYRHNGVDKVTGVGSGPAYGSLENYNLMGNVLYDFATGTQLTPHVGAGVGGAVVSANDIGTVNGRTLDGDRMTFAYQAIAGVSADVNDNWAVTADYHYVRTTDPDFGTSLGGHAATENASHNLMVGVRYTFGQPEPVVHAAMVQPPKPVMPKAEPPAAVYVPPSYMVFFDFDKAALTPEAVRIITAAAEEFKKGNHVQVVVRGHTDTMGTDKYNQKLSDRRAKAVKKEFVALGVPEKEITAIGVGKAAQLIPTNDQVREAQNRRAEIMIDNK